MLLTFFKRLYPASVLWILLSVPVITIAQSDTLSASLDEVVIRAYESSRPLKDVPAAVNHFNRGNLQMFGTGSIIAAVNTQPGARIEERSPGSYRVNIRGSSLRSPFGVRNVKVYYNNIPITDPGGITYLNQLGVYNFETLSIIKGPGSSVYGAGTGGVMLIGSLSENEPGGVTLEYSGGSYGYSNIFGSVATSNERYTGKVSFQHQSSDGFRDHSAMKRDVFSWSGRFKLSEKESLSTTFLYGNLFYETPGALTRTEFNINPRMSRPRAGAFPGAEGANASINQKQFIAGASYSLQLSSALESTTTLYGMFTDLRNPAIQNYAHSAEPHAGGRTVLSLNTGGEGSKLRLQVGTEWQQGFTSVSIFKNFAGRADSMQSADEIINRQGLVFAQAVTEIKNWTLTAGASVNFLRVNFERFAPASLGKQVKNFGNQIAPRIAILRKLGKLNVYSSVSRGFSPPTTSELLPTGGAVNLDLSAEHGTNYDLGLKGTVLKNLYADINLFYFGLTNTIVQRRTAGGGDYFINAGKTKQQGIESHLSYSIPIKDTWFKQGSVWLSHTLHDFHYADFRQLENDYSGNRMPGEPLHNISAGIQAETKSGFNGLVSYLYNDRIYLNDAGSAWASPFHIVSLKLGYTARLNKLLVRFSAGADNLLDQAYSLGNDVNGFNGRYYNTAAGRNYYAMITFQFGQGKSH
ncbi:TonB-dependent receptor [Segetibacter sp. 3557_3]|uniref:TonB-dependent receptor n=1 Tax=Segetibacter sp. 3557_3 TaxID=2547429 RepID=UPI0014055960|nr:TonB-dependent receptor plug domain-containing protein [Segetibacter sp. 3557_3]